MKRTKEQGLAPIFRALANYHCRKKYSEFKVGKEVLARDNERGPFKKDTWALNIKTIDDDSYENDFSEDKDAEPKFLMKHVPKLWRNRWGE